MLASPQIADPGDGIALFVLDDAREQARPSPGGSSPGPPRRLDGSSARRKPTVAPELEPSRRGGRRVGAGSGSDLRRPSSASDRGRWSSTECPSEFLDKPRLDRRVRPRLAVYVQDLSCEDPARIDLDVAQIAVQAREGENGRMRGIYRRAKPSASTIKETLR